MTEYCIWHKTTEKLPPKNVNVLIKYIDQDETDSERVAIGYKESDDPESHYWFDLSRKDWDGEIDAVFTVVWWAEIPMGPKIL